MTCSCVVIKARIHCKIFLLEHFIKYVFHDSVSLCKLPRNVHDIFFEAFHEIWKFWKLIFRIFSIVKDFPAEFVSMLDQFFCHQWRLQNVNIKGKSKHKVVFRPLCWKNWSVIKRPTDSTTTSTTSGQTSTTSGETSTTSGQTNTTRKLRVLRVEKRILRVGEEYYEWPCK